MAADTQAEAGQASKSETTSGKSTLATALKWIGSVAAVVSLLLGLNQVTGLWQKFRIHHTEFSQAMKAGELQQQRGDYPAAFDSFKHAVELDPIDRSAQKHEAQAAMLWLENVHAQNQSFTEIANQLLPVLDKSLTNSKGQEAADLLGHIGWANFLRTRDGSGSAGDLVAKSYEDAIKIDPENVYAHAMWAHWILWQNKSQQEAKQHFAAALNSGRVRPYVRSLQLSGYSNVTNVENRAELLRVANEMRRQGEALGPDQKSRVFEQVFWFQLNDPTGLAKVLRGESPEDVLATYDWLGSGRSDGDLRMQREFIHAFSLEVAGQSAEALSAYKSLQQQLGKSSPYSLSVAVNNAVKRLSDAKAK